MPADNGVRLDENEARSPSGPEFVEEHPEKPIAPAEFGPLDAQLEDRKLLAQGEIFKGELRAIRAEGTNDGEQHVSDSHR